MQMSRDKFSTVLLTAEIQGGELVVRQQFHRNYLGAIVNPKLSVHQQCYAFA